MQINRFFKNKYVENIGKLLNKNNFDKIHNFLYSSNGITSLLFIV